MTPHLFEAAETGDRLTPMSKGPLTTMHLMRWSAAMENWHRIHYDRTFTIEHEKLPDLLIQGSLKQQFLAQFLKDFAGAQGWLWKLNFQFRSMNPVDERLSVWGEVVEKLRLAEFGLLRIKIGILNDDALESAPGEAWVALPYQGRPGVPYPFIPPTSAEIDAARALEA